MTDRQNTTEEDQTPEEDLGAIGGSSGSLGGGSFLTPGGGAPSETAAAGTDIESGGTDSGVNPDEDSSYPSAMVGSTNATGHTVGMDVVEAGSNTSEAGPGEDVSGE